LTEKIEEIILANLIYNDTFTRKVIPYLIVDYFTESHLKILFEIISSYILKYNVLPTKEALVVDLLEKECSDEVKEQSDNLITELKRDPETSFEWLISETEKFCKDRAIYLALTQSLEIIQNKEKGKLGTGAIPNIMSNAIGFSFDTHIGHDYFDDAEKRYDFLHTPENKIPFDINVLNEITKGGLPNKTLTIIIAGANVGKSALLCHLAAANLKLGKNVLYITLEMSEESISQRIDANLLDMTIDDTYNLPKEEFLRRVNFLKGLNGGKLKVKEYPTKQAGSSNFRFLLNELKLKNNFIPDIIYVDYMNICTSSTLRGTKAPLDQIVVAISEELRGLAVEYQLPLVTASQLNREGFKKSDPGMEDTAQAFGIAWTGDFILALVRNDEMDAAKQLLAIQLKNRFSNAAALRRFMIGVDIEKMKFYDDNNGCELLNEATEAEIGQQLFDPSVDLKGNSFEGLF
jgi:replicative DNA helicase